MNDVRRAIAALVEAVDANPQQPQEISRRFGLDKTLTWKIARFLGDDDMFAAASHLPGRASVRNLVEALVKGGAAADRAASVLEAMDRFESIVATHAGDRETFEIMLGSASDGLARRRGEAARKQLYQGASAIWGVQARVHMSMHMIAPSAEQPDTIDIAVICGFIDFRRLRPNVSWTVSRRGTFIKDGTPQPSPNTVPLDPSIPVTAPPVLAEFCSDPIPPIRAVFQPASQLTRFELEPGPVGNTASANCILGWIARSQVSRYRREGDEIGENIVRLSTPAELLYHDLYVHKDLGFAIDPPPRLHIYSELPGGPSYPHDGLDAGRLPMPDDVIDLGETPTGAVTTDIPGYPDMVSLAIKRLGHGPADFHGFRCKLRFPPIPTLALLRYPLPERPR
ncbi:MAG: hypothetical protein AB7G11_12210 [Phycisphaerales bacterium]